MIVKSLDHLNLLSKKVANNLAEKDFIYLIGEIGVGKTTFTRNIINYLQEINGLKATEVLSPTFNLLYEYDIKNIKILHYDLYRIKEEKELKQLDIFSDNLSAIKITEWPNIIKTPLSNKLEIYLDYTSNENQRKIKFIGSDKWENFKDEL